MVDSDNDGFLSHAESGRAYAQLSVRIARDDVTAYFKSKPATTSGRVDFYHFIKGFVAFTEQSGESNKRRLIRKRPSPIKLDDNNLSPRNSKLTTF